VLTDFSMRLFSSWRALPWKIFCLTHLIPELHLLLPHKSESIAQFRQAKFVLPTGNDCVTFERWRGEVKKDLTADGREQ
jgi:hypothetical protein